MAKRDNFYRRSPGDALAGMVGMTLEERGVYNTIIDLLYLTWRPLEDNRAYIAGHCGCAVQKLNPIVASLIAKKKLIQFDEGGVSYLSNPRFEDERSDVKGATPTRSGRAEVGEKSAGVREKSAGVSQNPHSCDDEGQQIPSVTALEREEKRREDKPHKPPKGASVEDADVEAVWAMGSKASRTRSSKAELAKAMEARVRKGLDAASIRSGVAGYLATDDQTRDDGKFQQGIHRVVAGDRWLSFAEDDPPPLFRSAPPVDEIGSLEAPGPRRQRSWMRDWCDSPAQWREHERGPRPGQVGCRVWPEIQREHGVEPAAPQPVRGAA